MRSQTNYPKTAYRLIRLARADGATHMALDEAIWRAVGEGDAPPTLRLYVWRPPCLSLGRHQPLAHVSQEAIRIHGYHLVRRPTGGRAILHTDELTYSFIAPQVDPRVSGPVLHSCHKISQGLLAALARLGLGRGTAHQRPANGQEASAVCFESPADFEITVDGRKLIGSAQARGDGAVLQHGTLPLCGDLARICALLAVPCDPQHVHARATTLEQALQRPVSEQEAADAVAQGFAQALNLELNPSGLTARERQLARQLKEEKYAADSWTQRH